MMIMMTTRYTVDCETDFFHNSLHTQAEFDDDDEEEEEKEDENVLMVMMR